MAEQNQNTKRNNKNNKNNKGTSNPSDIDLKNLLNGNNHPQGPGK
jgi:hypothetical protein